MLRVRAPPVWRLESCTTPPPCPALAMLSVALRLGERGGVPAGLEAGGASLCSFAACAGLLRVQHYSRYQGGLEARKCVIANHPAMIATSRLALLSRPLRPLRYSVVAHAHNGRAVSRVSDPWTLPLNVFPHLGDSRTVPPALLLAAWPASTNPTAQAEAAP
jgi:hypothetical protein